MDKKTMDIYKEILENMKIAIMNKMNVIKNETLSKSARDSTGDLSGYSFHMADVGTDNFDREFTLSLASNDLQVAHRIEDALSRIDEGSFGDCLMCGNVLSEMRLQAVPYAEFCVKCQEQYERRNRRRA